MTAGITGYSLLFEDEDDHHVGRVELEVRADKDEDDPTKVRVKGVFGLRDWSNEFDDPYSGVVDVAVLADLEAVQPPGPGEARGDLVILGAEATKGSSTSGAASTSMPERLPGQLDPPHRRPTNGDQALRRL